MNGGFNLSTSDKHFGNAPASYYIAPNSVQLDQAAVYVERVPDTVQSDHFDWGFRVTQLYGLSLHHRKGIFQLATSAKRTISTATIP